MAAWEQPSQTLIPAQIPHSHTVHAPPTSQPACSWAYFTPDIFYLQINLESTFLTLQALAYCVILIPLPFLFHEEKVHSYWHSCWLACLSPMFPHWASTLCTGTSSGFLTNLFLPSFSPTSNLALSVLTQYKPAPIVSHILAFPPQYVTDRKAIPQLDDKGCAGNRKSA